MLVTWHTKSKITLQKWGIEAQSSPWVCSLQLNYIAVFPSLQGFKCCQRKKYIRKLANHEAFQVTLPESLWFSESGSSPSTVHLWPAWTPQKGKGTGSALTLQKPSHQNRWRETLREYRSNRHGPRRHIYLSSLQETRLFAQFLCISTLFSPMCACTMTCTCQAYSKATCWFRLYRIRAQGSG